MHPNKTLRHMLYGEQEGNCASGGIHFPFRNLTVDPIVPPWRGGTDHLENLQLKCGACESMKGTISQAALHAKAIKQGLGLPKMANQTEGDKLRPRIVELLHYSYQPSVAELNEEMRVDASFEELLKAALQPVKIRNVMPRKRKPYVQMLGFRHLST